MRISAAALLMIFTTIFLSACGKADMAALDDRGNNFYSRNGITQLGSYIPTVSAVPTSGIESRPLSAPFANQQTLAKPVAMASTGWQWPVQGRVTETYGLKSDGVTNEGIVISAADGTPIRAAQPGVVAFVGADNKNYGNIVILRHADGTMTSYSHTKTITVRKGEQVGNGGIIAYVGQSGNAKQPELHFAIREGRSAVDPMSKLPHQMASN
ncbi:MAG: murein hydrolase activator EnvC family protein [Rickettsiales bacterium]